MSRAVSVPHLRPRSWGHAAPGQGCWCRPRGPGRVQTRSWEGALGRASVRARARVRRDPPWGEGGTGRWAAGVLPPGLPRGPSGQDCSRGAEPAAAEALGCRRRGQRTGMGRLGPGAGLATLLPPTSSSLSQPWEWDWSCEVPGCEQGWGGRLSGPWEWGRSRPAGWAGCPPSL